MPTPPLLEDLLAIAYQRGVRAIRKGAAGFVGSLVADARKLAGEVDRRAKRAEKQLREMDPEEPDDGDT